MITNRSFMNQMWIDLSSPTKEEVDSIMLSENINPLIAKDLITPTPNQYSKYVDKTIYAVIHWPTFKQSHSIFEDQEIDFIISKDRIITTRYGSIEPLHFFAKQIEVDEILEKKDNDHLFFRMMHEIYKSLDNELSYTEDWMREIEKNIFEGKEKAMVLTISSVGRNLLNFRRTLEPHKKIFDFIKDIGTQKFGYSFGDEMEILIEEWQKIMKRLDNQLELVVELRETNNSILSTKQNEIMKELAILGSIMLPLTIIGQIFGMSIKKFPLSNDPNAFWIILGIMIFTVMITLVIAKIKKWM